MYFGLSELIFICFKSYNSDAQLSLSSIKLDGNFKLLSGVLENANESIV